MSKANNLTDFLVDIANAIRSKKGTTEPINPQDFSSEIESIRAESKLQSKSVMPGRNSLTVEPDTGYDGLSSVLVLGDSNLTSDNIRKGAEIFGISGLYVGSGGSTSAVTYSRPFNDIY